jgi:hypothetical protein
MNNWRHFIVIQLGIFKVNWKYQAAIPPVPLELSEIVGT